MDKLKVKTELIKKIGEEIATREARKLEHKKEYDEKVAKEQEQIDYFQIQLEAYQNYKPK